jgi:hypothetical protein
MSFEVGMRKDADAGPLDPRGCCYWGLQEKLTRGVPVGAYHHGETTWGGPLTHPALTCEVGGRKELDPGQLDPRGFCIGAGRVVTSNRVGSNKFREELNSLQSKLETHLDGHGDE